MANTSKAPHGTKYRTIADDLRRRIVAGELRPGDRLPTFAELHTQYQLGTNTINRVFLELENEGLVERRQGSGIYVAQPVQPARRYVLGLPSREMEGDLQSYGTQLLAGIRRATQYLLDMGHRRIAFMGQTAVLPTGVRLSGYRRSLEGAGIVPDSRWVRELSYGLPMLHNGRITMEQWLQQGFSDLGCTAVLAQNDHTAMGIIRALQAAGLRVPQDVSVIGFDGAPECELCSPTLTSVEVPLEQIGARAVALLLDNIERPPHEIVKVVMPGRLVERGSTARPANTLTTAKESS